MSIEQQRRSDQINPLLVGDALPPRRVFAGPLDFEAAGTFLGSGIQRSLDRRRRFVRYSLAPLSYFFLFLALCPRLAAPANVHFGSIGRENARALVTLIRIESGSGGTGSVVGQDQGSPRGSIDDLVSDACQRD